MVRSKSWIRIIAIALLVAPFLVALWALGIQFVTTGIGTSIMPVRLGVPPEIVILAVGPAR